MDCNILTPMSRITTIYIAPEVGVGLAEVFSVACRRDAQSNLDISKLISITVDTSLATLGELRQRHVGIQDRLVTGRSGESY